MYGYFEGAEKKSPSGIFLVRNDLAFKVPIRGDLIEMLILVKTRYFGKI